MENNDPISSEEKTKDELIKETYTYENKSKWLIEATVHLLLAYNTLEGTGLVPHTVIKNIENVECEIREALEKLVTEKHVDQIRVEISQLVDKAMKKEII